MIDFILKIVRFLDGKKAHLVALTIIGQVVWPFIHGDTTLGQMLSGENLKQILEGLGLSTLRIGVKKSGLK